MRMILILPIDYKNYPANWHSFSRTIRFDRAAGRCECEGECGENHLGRCRARNGQYEISFLRFKVFMIVLTVAHLWKSICRCKKKCAKASHVKAMCQRCHLAYDVEERTANARSTRRFRKDGRRELLELMK